MKAVPMPPLPDRRALAGAAIFLWVAVSPWAWGFAGAHPAVANHVALLFGFGPLALLIANLRAAAILTLLAGAWLVVSPWVLGYAGDHVAWLNELITGCALVVVCAHAAELRSLRGARLARSAAGPRETPAGRFTR
jgi:SPW repeat-containing protein